MKKSKIQDDVATVVQDKLGSELSIGDTVDVDDPGIGDMHSHGFTGEIVDIDNATNVVTVVDQDGDCWDIDSDNVTISD